MAKTKTPGTPSEFPDNTQHAVPHGADTSGGEAPTSQSARRQTGGVATFAPRRNRGARQRPHTPHYTPRGAHSRSLQADAPPTATPPTEESHTPLGSPDAAAPGRSSAAAPAAAEATLTLHVSATLLRQLGAKAREEGVSLTMLATELLAEGLVLRAWEILERQVTMRFGEGTMSSHAPSGGRGTRSDGGGYDRRGGRGGRRPTQRPRGNVMDDQATFLEYVRTHERKRR
jgi:hypothetical protein